MYRCSPFEGELRRKKLSCDLGSTIKLEDAIIKTDLPFFSLV
ncbi:MAG: hypothetical protein ACJATI_004989 [Halioglobus sp.]|jgi:hypothetical protein